MEGKEDTQRYDGNGAREVTCAMCRGELYPGDPYFELEGRIVCEDCLARYARGYFAHRRRRVARMSAGRAGGGNEGL